MDTEEGNLGRPGRGGEIQEGLGWRTEQEISMVLERDEQIMGGGKKHQGYQLKGGVLMLEQAGEESKGR